MNKKEDLLELINKEQEIRNMLKPIMGLEGYFSFQGVAFKQWLAEIKGLVVMLNKNELTNSIYNLINNFDGWHDEENFISLIAELKSLYKNFDILEDRDKNREDYEKIEEPAWDVIKICLRLQTDKHIMRGDENDINRSIRAHLESIGYNVSDQSQRGESVSGNKPGEIDILIKDKDNIPSFYMEGLKINCLDRNEISKHVNKIYNYDSNGVKTNIILIYSYAKDYKDLWDKYLDFIKTYKFDYEFLGTEDVSDDEYADLRIAKSIFLREGLERNLIHIFLNCGI